MRKLWMIALLLILGTGLNCAQQPTTSADAKDTVQPTHLPAVQRAASPVPIHLPEAKYTNYAREQRITGFCVVALVVDAEGKPQDIRVVKSLDPGLDQNAIKAVKKYQFKPAMLKDKPVPVPISIKVNFLLY